MRILVAGDWHSDTHEEPLANALEREGHEVVRFAWSRYFPTDRRRGAAAVLSNVVSRVQNKFLVGPAIASLNRDFLALACEAQPRALFVYRGTHIWRKTLLGLRARVPGVCLVAYNNDDPFSPLQPRWAWRHFLAGVPAYDLVLAYRQHNIQDFRRAGAQDVDLLRSWFIPERHHPVVLDAADSERFGCDVVFVGHFEPDVRIAYLSALVDSGVKLRLFGPDWPDVLPPALRALAPVVPVRGDDYVKALCGSKLALCFLSRKNRDTYTRRCFEIPATGTMMLSEFSEELASMFEEGREADYFRSPAELVRKVQAYLADDARRRAVAAAGLERVKRDGHDVASRARWLVWRIEEACRFRGAA